MIKLFFRPGVCVLVFMAHGLAVPCNRRLKRKRTNIFANFWKGFLFWKGAK